MTCVLVDREVGSKRERLLRAGKWLAEARMSRGLTQRAMAAKMGCSPQVLSTYERGLVQVPDDRAAAVADVLQLDVGHVRVELGLYVTAADRERRGVLRLPRGVKRPQLA